MSEFIVKTTPVDGVIVIEPVVKGSDREYLFELDLPAEFEIPEIMVENNSIRLPRGVLRGLHFHKELPQAKLVSVLSGSILDVVVDLRPESKTYGASYSVEISQENERIIYIPPHFAHGLLTLEQGTEIVFSCSVPHEEASESGIIWNDQILAIDWQFERYDIDLKWLNLSPKDKKRTFFRHLNPKLMWSK